MRQPNAQIILLNCKFLKNWVGSKQILSQLRPGVSVGAGVELDNKHA